jgi:hypothetical protein
MDVAPVCIKCKASMTCMAIGVSVGYIKTMAVYYGDRFQCHTCGSEIITNFGGPGRLSENQEPNVSIG